MKKHLKVLLALLLVFVCVIACVSCDNDKGNENPSGDAGQGTGNNSKDPNAPAVETYKIDFVYSYTTKIINEFGRPKTVEEKIVVKTIEIPKDNTGLTDQQRSEIASILYHGYGFAEWYTEDNWVVDAKNATQYPNPSSAPYSFPAGAITADMTLYAVKGDLAGRDASWSIDEIYTTNAKGEEVLADVVLTISGSGAMFDYENINAIDIPWYAYSVKEDVLDDNGNPVMESGKVKQNEIRNYEDITKIVIGAGITSVGRNAFRGLSGVTAIEFEEGSVLSYIGESAFKELSSLKTLKTPTSLRKIDKNAFENTGLANVWFGEGLTTIADSAFSGSKGISWIILPSTIETIGVAAFHPGVGQDNTAHSLSKIYYGGAKPANGESLFASTINTGMDNAPLTSKATLYYYKEYGDDAANVRDAFWYYFSYNDADGNEVVEPMAYCLTIKYYLPGQPLIAQWIDYVPAVPTWESGKNGGAYKLVGKIDQQNVDYREENVVYHGYKFAKFGDEDKYTLNGAKSSFCEGAKITDNMTCSLQRGKIVGEGGGVVFDYAGGTLTISLDPIAIKEGASTEMWNFESGEDTAALWTGSTSSVKNVKTVNIVDGVTYIGTLAFNNLISVPYIVIPASVTGIAATAFDACTNLKSIYYAGNLEDCKVYDANGNVTETTLADLAGSGYFGKVTFYELAKNGTAEDGSYWLDIEGKYLAWTLKTSTSASETYKTLYIAGDAEMADFASETSAPWYSAEVVNTLKNVTFADNILTIGENVLHRYSKVESISLSNNVTKIPASAFAGTALLENTSAYESGMLIINNLLLKVDSRRKNVEMFEIPFGTTLIAAGAFDGCDLIKELWVPSTVRSINDNAFAGLTSLNVIYTEALSSAWKNVSATSGYNPSVYVCGYDDNDINGNKNTGERLWYRDGKTNEIKLRDGFCVNCYHSDGTTTHASGESTCKHYWGEWYVQKLPTHTVNGVMARQCTKEGCMAIDIDKDTLLKVDTKVNGKYVHTFGEYVLDEVSYCTEDRTMSAKCLYCAERDVIVLEGTKIGSHAFVEYIVDENSATCYSVGTKTACCQNEFCWEVDVVNDPGQPKLEHNYGKSPTAVCVNDADCLAEFQYYYKCTNPGCTHKQYLDPVANENVQPHEWGEKVADKYLCQRATTTSSNVYYLSCTKCGVSCKDMADVENKTFVNYGTQVKTYNWDTDALNKIITSSGKFDVVSNLDKYNYATTVIYGAKKVLEIGKNTGATHAVLNIANSNVLVTDTNVNHEFKTQFKLGAVTGAADYVYRLGFSNGTASFFDLYFILEGDTVIVKNGYGKDATEFASFDKSMWVDISVDYNTKLQIDEIDETPVVDPSSPDYDPTYVPEPVIKTVYYYNVVININGTEIQYKQIVDTKDGIDNTKIAFVESEINADITAAKLYLEDTFIRSISVKALATPENTVADPVEDPGTSDNTKGEPQHKFDEDVVDDDAQVENPADGVTVTIKDGKKDADGQYVYIQSNVTGGKLNVSTIKNEKGYAFTSSTVFALIGELTGGASKLFVFESDLTIGAGKHQLIFANAALTLQSFGLDLAVTEDGLVITNAPDYVGLDGQAETFTIAGITAETEFNLRIELYRVTTTDGEKLIAKIYVNDVYVGSSDAAAISKNKVEKFDIEAVAIYHDPTAENTAISFDNVYVTVSDENVSFVPEVVLD